MNFQAIVLREINKLPELEDIKIINTLKPGQVLIKIITSGLCGAQLQEIAGEKNNAKYLPHTMGHEGYGEILESTPESIFKPGQKVILHWRENYPLNIPPVKYEGINGGPVNTLSTMSVVLENRLTPAANFVSPTIGALLGCSLTTAYGITRNMKVNRESTVLICGGGGVGLTIALMLKNKTNIDVYDNKCTSIKKTLSFKLGVYLMDNIQGKYDYIIDTVGNNMLLSTLPKFLNKNGQLIMVAKPSETINFDPVDFFKAEGITISSTQGGSCIPTFDIPNLLYENKDIKLDSIVTHSYDLSKFKEAVDLMKSGLAGRIVFNN